MRSNTGRREAPRAAPTPQPEVEVSAEAKGAMAEIVVTDRGPGVPASDRERVLGRFVRLEASRSEPGSGLRFEPCRGRGAAAWWQPET